MTVTVKKPKALSTQLYERRRCEEFNRVALQNMNVAASRGRRRKGKPQFTEEEKAAIFKKLYPKRKGK
jgi:hypothetical protein